MTANATPEGTSAVDGPNTIREAMPGVLVITLKGPSLSEADTSGVLAEVGPEIAQARGAVLLDMARIEYMSSAGISMLVQIREACTQAGGSLTLSGLAGPIAGVLKTTKVDRLFTIAKDREKALAKLRKS
ncbi:MAG: STAS domain-containing protein [Phycisphaerales bacterium]|jgi:anti-anti-sigma factor